MNYKLIFVLLAAASTARAADWITAPSYYSHDPQSGERVQQYSPIGPFYTYPRGDFVRSGFRHHRSSIQVGTSTDQYHVVEKWGKPLQPYGEWRYPFRPYSVPYPEWGSPFAGLGYGSAPYFGYPSPYGRRGGLGGVGPGGGPGGHPDPGDREDFDRRGRGPGLFSLPPYRDGRYLPFRTPDPFERQRLLPSDPDPIPPYPLDGEEG